MWVLVCQNFRNEFHFHFGRNLPLATFGSERVKRWLLRKLVEKKVKSSLEFNYFVKQSEAKRSALYQ